MTVPTPPTVGDLMSYLTDFAPGQPLVLSVREYGGELDTGQYSPVFLDIALEDIQGGSLGDR